LIDGITKILYTNISRGLFENDKIIYSFLIASSISRNAKLLEESVWNIFLRGPTVFTSEENAGKLKCPDNEFINKINWDTICSFEIRAGE